LKIFIRALFIWMFLVTCAQAVTIDINDDNSCISNSDPVFDNIKNNIFSAKLYNIIDRGFNMKVLYPNDGCNKPTEFKDDEIKFIYGDNLSGAANYTLQASIFTSPISSPITVGMATFRAVASETMICVETLLSIGWATIGCRSITFKEPTSFNKGCMTEGSCVNHAARQSKSFFPITSVVMQCVKETVFKVFIDPNVCARSGGNPLAFFADFQKGMRQAVKAALTLYIIFFGVKIAIGSELPRNSEVFMFIIKMMLVYYFSVGFGSTIGSSATYSGSNTSVNSPTNDYGGMYVNAIGFNNGIQDFVLPAMQILAYSLANLVGQSTGSSKCGDVTIAAYQDKMIKSSQGNNGLCYFDASSYPDGYQYLALWDSLDCKIAFYLGFNNPNALLLVSESIVLYMIGPAFMGFQIILVILLALFAVFLLSMVVYFVNTFIIAIIGMAIIAYLAPIFVPMALFEKTSEYFQGWRRLLLSFAIQPVVVSAFLALTINVFDGLMFKGCCWSNIGVVNSENQGLPAKLTTAGNSKGTVMPVINNPNDVDCKNSPGGIMFAIKNNQSAFETIGGAFFNVTVLNWAVGIKFLPSMVSLVLFAYLFYHFAQILSDFAADLTSGPALGGMAINPNSVLKSFGNMAKNAALAKLGSSKKAKDSSVTVAKGSTARSSGVSVTTESKRSEISVTTTPKDK
jgi:type IV secretion system protein VirB6